MRIAKNTWVVIVLLAFIDGTAYSLAPGSPLTWGNATYYPVAVGEKITYSNKDITLVSLDHNFCTVRVGQTERKLIVARRNLPVVVEGVRVFVSDNRNVASITQDRRPNVHAALAGKDAVLCLSDPDKPLLDPEQFAFPISRSDGWEWANESNSHIFAYLLPDRSHEGIDVDIHDGRGKRIHALLALEDGVVRGIQKNGGKYEKEARVSIESANYPGVFYGYSHLNDETLTIEEGQPVRKGEKLGYIWGDDYWGHLHLSVSGWGELASASQGLMNPFPQMYELYYGSLEYPTRTWTKSSSWRYVNRNRQDIDFWIFYCNTFHDNSIKYGNRVHREGYNEVVGFGWDLGTWCTAYKMESESIYQDANLRITKTLFAGTAAEATNPNDYYDFEVAVENGEYEVRAEVGDASRPSWQRVTFEGVDAGVYELTEEEFEFTPTKIARVDDGRLTIRFYLKDEKTCAGIRRLYFNKR